MTEIRKLITARETAFSEFGVEEARPITGAVAMAVVRNLFAGGLVEI